jgi:predicted flap endonuclease-1-like 5' DNA nuclease
VAEPALINRVEGEEKYEGKRPIGYVAPRSGVPDNLQRIKGIGPQNEGRLHALGVWHYSQIASWSRANAQWVGNYLSFPGRIDRERWIEQATELAAGLDVGKQAPRPGNAQGEGNVADRRRSSVASDAPLKGH